MKLKKFLHLFIILTMMSFFMFGCRNAEADTDSSTETETISAEAPETATEVENPQKEEVEESEVVPEEEVAEEPTQPEEVEEPEVVEDPGEVTYITDFTSISDFISTLDPTQPEIIVYNKFEPYIIVMQEGQHYQLKSNDQIIFNISDESILCGWDFDLGGDTIVLENYEILKPVYSNWEQNQEFFFTKEQANGEDVRRTCYFDPPTE